MCVNYFAKAHGIRFERSRGNARVGEGNIGDVPLLVARPQTFMNASGKSIGILLNKLKIIADDLIVIHDDLDLPVGRIRIRKGGSSGGHKGVQSIIGDIGTADFVRIRVGIGRPQQKTSRIEHEQDILDYVLGGFSSDERRILHDTFQRVNEAIECMITVGLVPAMNQYNAEPGK
jgi:peptidyl-tRNA hydrolase, PTH1 family